jgi:hypothetical protein
MPFKKVGPDDYVSPSGRHYSKKQIALYYATDGFKRKPKKKTKKKTKKRKKS